MKNLLFAILLYPVLVKSQSATIDSAGNIVGYTKTNTTDTGRTNIYTYFSTIIGTIGAKQNSLVSATNIKTVNGVTLLGSGDLPISAGFVWGSATGTLANQTDLQNALNAKQASGSYAITTNNLSDLSNVVTARTNLGVAIGSNVQAFNANLTTYAGITPSANVQTLLGSADFAAFKTSLSLSNVTNESKATMFTSPTFTGTPIFPSGVITNANLAGSIDLATKVTGVLPFASNAGVATAAAATTGTVSVPLTSRVITVTPSGAITFNGTGGVVGQQVTFVVTTSGVSSFNITFGTAFRSIGVLATGTTTAKIFTVSFICTAATPLWVETGRTAAQ